MIQSGHGDEIAYAHSAGYFVLPWTQSKWLGYKRCWEEQVLKEDAPSQGHPIAATDFVPPNPNTEEFVFVGGPLHGLHHMSPDVPWLVTEENSVQYLYVKTRPTSNALSLPDPLPIVFVLYAMHTLR